MPHTHTHTHKYIHIYIERERVRRCIGAVVHIVTWWDHVHVVVCFTVKAIPSQCYSTTTGPLMKLKCIHSHHPPLLLVLLWIALSHLELHPLDSPTTTRLKSESTMTVALALACPTFVGIFYNNPSTQLLRRQLTRPAVEAIPTTPAVVAAIPSLLAAVLTATPLLLPSGETVPEALSRFATLVEFDSRRKKEGQVQLPSAPPLTAELGQEEEE
ncbi:unnamed protein product [Camellia sinensis]